MRMHINPREAIDVFDLADFVDLEFSEPHRAVPLRLTGRRSAAQAEREAADRRKRRTRRALNQTLQKFRGRH